MDGGRRISRIPLRSAGRLLIGRRCHASTSTISVDATTKKHVDTTLQRQETTVCVHQGSVHSMEANQLAANSPCEDQMTAAHCMPSDAWLFGVFDGHGGPTCARQISARLFDYVCAAVLSKHRLQVDDRRLNAPETLSHYDEIDKKNKWHNIAGCRRLYATADPSVHPDAHVDHDVHRQQVLTFTQRFRHSAGDDGTVREALQAAFVSLDDQMSDVALSRTPHEYDLKAVLSGSTACVAHIRKNHLHIGNVGDSMAVLGVLADHGGWTARTLSHSHTTENAHEVDRIRAAHPVQEFDSVLKGGRLLGQLYPLRAFGDVVYKWSADIQSRLGIIPPPRLLSPPYLTALPEVYYHRLTKGDRFLVLATDGLWDLLSPESVVRLVSDHMLGKETLGPYSPTEGANIKQILTDLTSRAEGVRRRPIDANVATHIIRHALGGNNAFSQYGKIAAHLALPISVARDYRDDISVQVIYFNQ